MPSILNATTSSGLVTSADNSGSLQLATNNGTTAVTIDTSQNVGIGTSSPTAQLQLNKSGTGDYTTVRLSNSGASGRTYEIGLGGNTAAAGYANSLYFYDSNAGAIRSAIDSSGNFLFNSGYGSVATAYGCRAWVNFNGTGTVAIRASGNVSSITDNGTGDYSINFSTAMPDANYSFSIANREDTGGAAALGLYEAAYRNSTSITTTALRVFFAASATAYDVNTAAIAVFR
jgi:hypothetical protein